MENNAAPRNLAGNGMCKHGVRLDTHCQQCRLDSMAGNYPVPAIPIAIEWHHSPAHVAGVDTNYLNLFEGNNAVARKQWGERMKHGEPGTLEFYVWDCHEYRNYR